MTLAALLIFLISYKNTKGESQRTILTLLNISIYVYSGIGTCYKEVNNIYILYFLIFIASVDISIVLSFRHSRKHSTEITTIDYIYKRSPKLLMMLSILMYIMIIINLIFPEVIIHKLWQPDLFTLMGFFERTEDIRNNNISYLTNIMKINLLPFFFMYLYYLKQEKKSIKVILLVTLWIYMDFTVIGYIGRYQMIIYSILLFLIYFEKNGSVKKRFWIIAGVIFLLTIPLLLAYESIRLGVLVNNNSTYIEKFKILAQKESNYPQYYSFLSTLKIEGIIIQYFTWFFTLFIPKRIIPINQIVINDLFTFYISGLTRGMRGFCIYLPSILGEAILIYGDYFFWIHGLFIGITIGFLYNVFSKSKSLLFWNYYLAVNILTIGRGGTQGFFSTIISSMLLTVIVAFIVKSSKGYSKYKKSLITKRR